jgi:hypothetical protein
VGRIPSALVLPLLLMGSGAEGQNVPAQVGIRIQQPRVEGLPSAMAAKLAAVLDRNLHTWQVRPEGIDSSQSLSTLLSSRPGGGLRLRVSLHGSDGSLRFRRIYSSSEGLFDRMVLQVTNDLSLQVSGRPIPALNRLLAVKEVRPGVSEIVLTDAAGATIDQLTWHGSLTLSPTSARQGRFAYVTYVAGPPQIWGMDLKDRRPRRLFAGPTTGCVVSQPAMSPDGSCVAFVESDPRGLQRIQLVDWRTGVARPLTQFAVRNASPAWSPDGNRLAFTHGTVRQDSLMIVSRDGTVQKTVPLPWSGSRDPCWTRDGKALTFAATLKDGSGQLRRLDLATGEISVLRSEKVALANPRWGPIGDWLTYEARGRGTWLLFPATGVALPFLENLQARNTLRWVW